MNRLRFASHAVVAAFAVAGAAVLVCSTRACAGTGVADWATYNGSPAQTHYSTLQQINRSNVGSLKPAWRFDTGETGGMQTNPLVIAGTLYGITPSQKIVALDATTGKLKWKFDSGIRGQQPDRGLVYWANGRDERILVGIMNYLYALNARTGAPIDGFGAHGRVDLREGLGRLPVEQQAIALTTPGILYKDLIIVGGREPESLPSPPGDIRAFDVRTGQMRWSFHTIPHPGEAGYETWPPNAWRTSGSANNWAGMALDAERGIVFAPTGPAANDFYGADRHGDNLFGNCLLALDASTGKRLWHFQAVKHDLWDRDLPASPTLLTVTRGNRKVDAVAQLTKQGFVLLFDRLTGQPLFPIVERPVAQSQVPGELSARSQPFPTLPAPFARQQLTEDLLTARTTAAHNFAVEQFRTFVSQGAFVPLGLNKPTIVFPGFDGGAEWGGAAVDPRTSVLYVNSNDVAWTASLVKREPTAGRASEIYQSHCAACHGLDHKGSPPAFPSLIGISARLSTKEMEDTVRWGRGRMPSFAGLPDSTLHRLVDFLRTGIDVSSTDQSVGAPSKVSAEREVNAWNVAEQAAYVFSGYKKFLDPDGYPAVAPPWGTLSAIDLNTGQFRWRIPLGEYPELKAQGIAATGTENYGGPIVTAGGLLFIGATLYDHQIRAFDSETGKLLWSASLPSSGIATPATYQVAGRQYVVIATSDHSSDATQKHNSAYIAFALPK